MNNDVAIVLTGTIIPQTRYVKYTNWQKRREEYLAAIRYYRQFGSVFFVENSDYDLANDADFQQLEDVHYMQIEPDTNREHTIGYQEFHMLDAWVQGVSESPRAFIKVSGRYILDNFAQIYEECCYTEHDILINLQGFQHWAITYVFYSTVKAYRQHILGKYRYCNVYVDIEEILYQYFRDHFKANYCIFYHLPELSVVSAGQGTLLKSHSSWLKRHIIHPLNYKIYPKCIIYPSLIDTPARISKWLKKLIRQNA